MVEQSATCEAGVNKMPAGSAWSGTVVANLSNDVAAVYSEHKETTTNNQRWLSPNFKV